MAVVRYLTGRNHNVFVVGEPALRETLETGGVRLTDAPKADVVVVGIDFNFTYAVLDQASRAIRGGAEFIATNTDTNYPTPTGLAPGAGSIVGAVELAAGTTPVVVGKPEQPMIDLLTDQIRGRDVWVVGDRPETDVAMAHRAGWRSILPLTGVVADVDDLRGRPNPDHLVGSIADVPALLRT
jgi:HAD superfamily hydrolase (TIGR01450 family)